MITTTVKPTLVTGTTQIAGGRALWKQRQKQSAWPFPWVERPIGSQHVFVQGAIAAPAAPALTTIAQYTVDDGGFYFAPDGIVLFYQVNGNQGAYSPGDFFFSLNVNSINGGPNALPYTYFQNIQTCLGSPQQGPWPIMPGELSVLHSRDVLSANVINVNVNVGSPNFFVAMISGWTWPIEEGFSGT
jgi:hypothetical protein